MKSIEDLQQSVVKVQDGKPILLQDVAKVQTGAALKRGDASFNGQSAVVMMINKQPDVDTPTVAFIHDYVFNNPRLLSHPLHFLLVCAKWANSCWAVEATQN